MIGIAVDSHHVCLDLAARQKRRDRREVLPLHERLHFILDHRARVRDVAPHDRQHRGNDTWTAREEHRTVGSGERGCADRRSSVTWRRMLFCADDMRSSARAGRARLPASRGCHPAGYAFADGTYAGSHAVGRSLGSGRHTRHQVRRRAQVRMLTCAARRGIEDARDAQQPQRTQEGNATPSSSGT